MKSRYGAVLGSTALAGLALAAFFGRAAPTAGTAPPQAGRNGSENSPLSAGTDVVRTIAGHERHAYSVALRAGDALHVVVTQHDVDVALVLFDPQGRRLLAVDGPNGPDGPEPLAVVASREGEHQLEVTAPSAKARGHYRLHVATLGSASDRDRARAAGMRLYALAEPWRQKGAETRGDALRAYTQALDHFRHAGELLLEARTCWRIGQVLLARRDVDEAIRYFDQAVDRYRHQGNGWERAPLYNDAGEAYRLAGRPQRARELFEKALAASRPVGHRLATALAFNNLGVLHASLGEMQEALVAYDRARREWQLLGNQSNLSLVLHNQGILYVSLGRPEEGLDFLSQALESRRETEDRGGQAVTLTGIGWAHSLQGRLDAALAAYDEALRLQRAVNDEQREAVTLDKRGTLYLLAGRYSEALDSYSQALKRSAGSRLNEAYTRVNLGRAHLAMGRAEVAIDPLERALRTFREIGVLNGQTAALVALARVERQLGRLPAAREHLEAALELIESVRGRLQSRWLRSSYLAVRYDDYTAYVDLLMELEAKEPGQGHAARAFEASERSRARTLLESLTEASAGLRETADPELLERERILRTQINAWERRRIELLAAGSNALAHALERKLRRLLLEYEKLQGEIRSAGASSVHEPRPLNLDQIRREVLDDETLLLAYSLGEDRSFLWIVGRETLTSHVLAPRSKLDELARQVHDLLPRSHRRGFRRQAAMDVEALSDAVLGPAAGQLGTKRLLIVGDGVLHYVPFAALPVPRADGLARPLLVDHEIVHLPSASVLALLRRELSKRPPAARALAVVADPVFQPNDPRLSESPHDSTREAGARGLGSSFRDSDRDLERVSRDFDTRFERLPFSGVEAEAILSLVEAPERLRAVGVEASRELMLSGQLEHYRIVHVATHGLLNDRHPALSGLVLALVDEAGQSRDGLLRTHELFDLRLSADLVVLSACRSALGREVRGEGLVGLTHGFFYAGAARLVVSFWNVNDQATAELMARFYQGLLRDDLPPAQALREAQLSMLAEPRWQAPYYWAGFVLQGDWR